MSSVKRLPVFALFLLLGSAGISDAQTFRGGISGRVADSSGAVLPGVTVTATNDATGVSRTTVTSAGGDFSVPDLQLGTYTIEAALQGFQTLRTKLDVSVSQIASVELKMGLSATTWRRQLGRDEPASNMRRHYHVDLTVHHLWLASVQGFGQRRDRLTWLREHAHAARW